MGTWGIDPKRTMCFSWLRLGGWGTEKKVSGEASVADCEGDSIRNTQSRRGAFGPGKKMVGN